MFFCCTCNITEISHFLWCITVFRRFSPFFCCSPFHMDFICERFFYFSSSFCLRFIADSSCGSNECFNALWSKYSSYASTIQQKFTNFMEQNERRRDKKISNYVNMNQTKRRINHTSTHSRRTLVQSTNEANKNIFFITSMAIPCNFIFCIHIVWAQTLSSIFFLHSQFQCVSELLPVFCSIFSSVVESTPINWMTHTANIWNWKRIPINGTVAIGMNCCKLCSAEKKTSKHMKHLSLCDLWNFVIRSVNWLWNRPNYTGGIVFTTNDLTSSMIEYTHTHTMKILDDFALFGIFGMLLLLLLQNMIEFSL